MNITSCLHPKKVWNKYSKEYVYAPCGTCPECFKHKSANWTQRLIQERYSWKYCVFFTLTYDNEHIPTLKAGDNHRIYYDLSHKHYHPEYGDVFIDVNSEVLTDKYKYEEPALYDKNKDWLSKNDTIYYLSVGDAQRFIKRLRINVARLVRSKVKDDKKNNIQTNLTDKDEKFRYYLIGEYGESSTRPHYHGLLFFNSEFQASHIKEMLCKSWTFGNLDSSFVSGNNASYVAGYVNSNANLPKILLHKRIRPFSIFSKHPFIGSLCSSTQEVKEMFFRASPKFTIFNHEQGIFDNVPLWLSYRRKLYPKLSGFSNLSHYDRVILYGAFQRFEQVTDEPSFRLFIDYVQGKLSYVPQLFKDYSATILSLPSIVHDNHSLALYDNSELSPLLSWYYTSSRVCAQARSFGISVREYVCIIERFYNNLEKEKLKEQYQYQQDLSDRGRLDNALALHRDFVEHLLSCDSNTLTDYELDEMISFGIDPAKFYSLDDSIRTSYRYSVLPDSCLEYKDLTLDSKVWLADHTKSKKKNDYLINHPELSNKVWD